MTSDEAAEYAAKKRERDELARIIANHYRSAAVDAILAAGYRKQQPPAPDLTYWGVRIHPEDPSIRNGTWDAWDVLDYGTDKSAAQSVRKGLATRQLMKKTGVDGEWECA